MGHRSITRRQVGEQLYDDFEPFSSLPTRLISVYANGNSTELLLNCVCGGLYFRTEADETLWWNDGARDELAINLTEQTPWSDRIGLELDCVWMNMNHKGHIDGALLGFGNLPSLALNVRASEITIAIVGKWNRLLEA